MVRQDQIICGDCLDVMRDIDDESIDFMVTSPPYNVGTNYDIYDDNRPWIDYVEFIQRVMIQVYRVIKPDGRIAINISHVVKNKSWKPHKHFPLSDFLEILLNTGFNIREIISWFKASDENHFSGGSTAWGSWKSASNPYLRGQVEVIIVANKGSWKKESGSRVSDIAAKEFKEWTKSAWFMKAEAKRIHPAPFPIEVPLRLIKLYTFVGDVVLDPFIGSGTTAIACVRTKRDYIGIDISPEYVKMAKERIMVETFQ